MSAKRALIRLLDRRGGRFILGKIATAIVRRGGGDGVQISYTNGFWTRRIGNDFFPDALKFGYEYTDFSLWRCQMDHYAADTKEYWLRHYIPKQGDVIVDVGAGRGEDVSTFSRAVGETGRVIAIESHPVTFAILKRFCQLNNLTNVTALNLALMDKPGEVRVGESEISWQVNAVVNEKVPSAMAVRAATLADLCEEHRLTEIAFLKMNIEGAERSALLGMKSVMARIRQICVACHDFWSEHGHGDEFRTRAFVQQFLVDQGFALETRRDDPRDFVRDHIFGLRPE